MIDIKISENKNDLSCNEINALMEKVGWGRSYYSTEEKWQRVLKVSTHIAYAKIKNELIAFGRILEDGIMCMFYDLCVHPQYQKRGIGTDLMNHLINKVKDHAYVSIGLFTWEGNKTVHEFYEKFHFEKSNAMQLKMYMKTV